MGYEDNTYLRYARESGADVYTYVLAGSTTSTKYSLNADGTNKAALSTSPYTVTAAQWYQQVKTTYGFETWSALGSSKFNGVLYQSFAAAIYQTPNLVNFKGCSAVLVDLAYCEAFLFYI